jgi:hypothetical protein
MVAGSVNTGQAELVGVHDMKDSITEPVSAVDVTTYEAPVN